MDCGPIRAYLETAIGLDSESIGRKKIQAVAAARMREQGLEDPAAYCRLLAGDAREQEHIIEEIVVSETWFFRDTGPFSLLADLCSRGELTGSQTRPLRVLSLPCATGEEPYSIAMTLVDAGLHPAWLQIDAVDISSRALAKARQGRFDRASFRGAAGRWQERYFSVEGTTRRLQAPIAGLVQFQQGNILAAGFPLTPARPYRIIFCRNLLIYLTQNARQRVFELLDSLLEPGGLLFAGHTEVLLFQQFGYELMPQKGCFACKKPPAPAAAAEPARPAARQVQTTAGMRRPRQPKVFKNERPQAGGDEQNMLDTVRGLADRGELAQAARLGETYVKSAGSLNAGAHCLMGEISQARKEVDAAERFFLRAVYLDPACYDALVHLSLLYEQKGSCDKARRYRQRARRLHEDTA